MKKINKFLATTLAIGVMTTGLGAVASAADYTTYTDKIIPVWEDFETGAKTKVTTGSAYNEVTFVQEFGKLVSWIEKDSSNVTNKVSYSTPGVKTMDYEGASALKGKSMYLNISTSVGQLSTVKTSGKWTPN